MSVPSTPQPATQQRRDRAAKVVADGLRDLVFQSPGLFRDRPGFINGGGGTDVLSNTVRAISQLNCRVWAAADKSNYSERVNAGNANLCSPYLASIGEEPDDGSIPPQYQGGQCDFEYRVWVTNNGVDLQIGGQTPRTLQGPLGGVERVETVVSPGPSGSTRVQFIFSGPNDGPEATIVTSFKENLSFRVEPFDSGDVDLCGNAPATTIQAPSTVTPATPIPPRIEVNIPGFGPVNVNVNLDPNGDPIVCIEELDVCVTVEVDGSGDDGPGGGAGGDVAPTNPGEGGEPALTGTGGDAEGEAPEESELTGLLVEIVSSNQNANKYDNVSESVFRGIGYVSMGYPGLLGIDTSAIAVINPQFFHAQQRGLTAWRVRSNIGFNLRVTPYYREV